MVQEAAFGYVIVSTSFPHSNQGFRELKMMANYANSMIKGYHRSTRYQKLDGSSPRFLAMHELDSFSNGPEMKLVLGTEWAKKVLSKVTASSSEVWEYITELGKDGLTETQLKF